MSEETRLKNASRSSKRRQRRKTLAKVHAQETADTGPLMNYNSPSRLRYVASTAHSRPQFPLLPQPPSSAISPVCLGTPSLGTPVSSGDVITVQLASLSSNSSQPKKGILKRPIAPPVSASSSSLIEGKDLPTLPKIYGSLPNNVHLKGSTRTQYGYPNVHIERPRGNMTMSDDEILWRLVPCYHTYYHMQKKADGFMVEEAFIIGCDCKRDPVSFAFLSVGLSCQGIQYTIDEEKLRYRPIPVIRTPISSPQYHLLD